MSDFEILKKYGLKKQEVVDSDIMTLNTLLTDKLVPKRDIREIKCIRRRIKMRKYRNESSTRQKLELNQLVQTRDSLLDEAIALEDEIEELRHKMTMIELLDLLNHDF